MFVSIKNECLIVTNFTLVNLNLSSITYFGESYIWTENEKVWWDKLCRSFLTIASKLLKSDIRLCLVECKIFSEGKIFSSENIFGKGKYFQVFGCVAKNALENPFLSCFSHFLRIQTNTITKIKTKKKFKITRPIGARSVRRFVGSSVRMRDGLIDSWVRGAISLVDEVGRSVRGFVAWSHRRMEGTRTVFGSWVRDAISPSRGGDEDSDLTGAISLSLSVCASVSPFSLSVSLFAHLQNNLKVKQKLKIFSGSKGLFYGQSKWFSGKLYFPCATKHTVSCKRISWNRFQPKQTQPKMDFFFLVTLTWQCMSPISSIWKRVKFC